MENNSIASYDMKDTESVKSYDGEISLKRVYLHNVENPINRVLGFNKTDTSDGLEPILGLEI